jgi:hypothetical protein
MGMNRFCRREELVSRKRGNRYALNQNRIKIPI